MAMVYFPVSVPRGADRSEIKEATTAAMQKWAKFGKDMDPSLWFFSFFVPEENVCSIDIVPENDGDVIVLGVMESI